MALSSFHPPFELSSTSRSLARASKPQLTYTIVRTSFVQLIVCFGRCDISVGFSAYICFAFIFWDSCWSTTSSRPLRGGSTIRTSAPRAWPRYRADAALACMYVTLSDGSVSGRKRPPSPPSDDITESIRSLMDGNSPLADPRPPALPPRRCPLPSLPPPPRPPFPPPPSLRNLPLFLASRPVILAGMLPTLLSKHLAFSGFSSLQRSHPSPSPPLLLPWWSNADRPSIPTPAYSSHTLLPGRIASLTSFAMSANPSKFAWRNTCGEK